MVYLTDTLGDYFSVIKVCEKICFIFLFKLCGTHLEIDVLMTGQISFRAYFPSFLTKFLGSCIKSLLQNWKHPWIILYSTCYSSWWLNSSGLSAAPGYKNADIICLSNIWRQDLILVCDNLRLAMQFKDSLYWDILNSLANWRNFRLKLNSKLWKWSEWAHLISLGSWYDVFLGTVGDHINQAESW